jgi:hypothetical protein
VIITSVWMSVQDMTLFIILPSSNECKSLFNTHFVRDSRYHKVYTEWQRPLSGVHSIMMEKLVQAGEGGDARPPPFIIFTITYKVAVYASSDKADTLPLFHLYPYVTCG